MPAETLADHRWNRVRSLFDVGFTHGINRRFHTADDLLQRLQEIADPRPRPISLNRVEEAYQKFLEFEARAEVEMEKKITDAMIKASEEHK